MEIQLVSMELNTGLQENPLCAIRSLHWIHRKARVYSKHTREELYDWIKNENGRAYIVSGEGMKSYVLTAISPKGTKYLITEVGKEYSDELLLLPVFNKKQAY
jgi:hypothetical protein